MIGFLRTFFAVAVLVMVVPLAALIAFPWTFISGKINFLLCRTTFPTSILRSLLR
jgi:hypothetical protein